MAATSNASSGTIGRVVRSDSHADVHYELQHRIGEGGMAVAYFALRRSPEGTSPVVLKITRPEVLMDESETAHLSFKKEVIALGRLEEQVPRNPFVVRLVDVGSVSQQLASRVLELPWVALEHVNGGAEGSTLFERVSYSVSKTGYAFDPSRAAHCLECISSGLAAIHEVGVVHRDLSPSNVLCCGFGENELFKIADFGIARAQGVQATFGDIAFGTPGYSAPEQMFEDRVGVGPWSDVFSLACIAFYVLTGEDYLPVRSATDALLAVRGRQPRRRLSDCPRLAPDLAEDPATCAALDEIIASGTAPTGDLRPQRATQLATSLLPHLTDRSKSRRPADRQVASVLGLSSRFDADAWTFTVRHPPGGSRIVRSAAWDGDGHCLAATLDGLEYWNGERWRPAVPPAISGADEARFVHRIGPGRWLVGYASGRMAAFSATQPVQIEPSRHTFHAHACSGDVDDLMVLAGITEHGAPGLCARLGGRWLKPLPLAGVASITSVARVEAELWLVAGRSQSGRAFLARYAPLDWELSPVDTELPGRAMLACAGQADRGIGLSAGAGGSTVRYATGELETSCVPGGPDLSVAALDVLDREWVGSRGQLWARDPALSEEWSLAWADPQWSVPFVSLLAEPGVLIGLTVDGAVLEGQNNVFAAQTRPHARLSRPG